MEDYKKLYYSLFNDLTDAVQVAEQTVEKLKQIQRDAEELFLSMGDEAK